MPNLPTILSPKDPFFGLRILQPSEDPSLPPKRILNYKDGTELVYIPPGPFWMGDDELDVKLRNCPRHKVYVDGYYMAVRPVTNKQYRRFMWETGHKAPKAGSWGGKAVWRRNSLMVGYEEHPVVCVSWKEAVAYGTWATLRLPSEAEWEKAAGGPQGLKYPWGNEWEEDRCRYRGNRGEETTTLVRAYPRGTSVYGCEQMSGNVWEWCEDWYGETSYNGAEGRTPREPTARDHRVVRGGSWRYDQQDARVAHRSRVDPCKGYDNLGFRLTRSFP